MLTLDRTQIQIHSALKEYGREQYKLENFEDAEPVSAVVTVARRDAGTEPPWMGLRRVTEADTGSASGHDPIFSTSRSLSLRRPAWGW